MSNISATLYPCAHCNETGTCRTGRGETSCASCVERNSLKGTEHYGLTCGVCGGMGKAEPATERLNKRMAPILAYAMVMLLLFGIAISAYTDKHFSEILAFSGTVIGAITGFYFSRSQSE